MVRLHVMLGLLALSTVAFGQTICNSPAVGIQPYSLVPGSNGAPVHVPQGFNEALGYIPQPYAALPNEPAKALAFCGPTWQASYSYAVGNMIQLPDGTVLEAISCKGGQQTCQSGATEPAGFSGPVFWPSPVLLWVSTCSDPGSTATCNTVAAAGTSAPVNVGEPYPGANVGATMVIITYGPDPKYNSLLWPEWMVTASTGSKPYSFAFAGSGLGSGDCTALVGTTSECVSYQHGSLIVDNEVTWQDVGPQNETLLTPLVDVVPASWVISGQQSLQVTIYVGGGSKRPTPGGSVTLVGGNFSSGAVALSSCVLPKTGTVGCATITIPAGSLVQGTDTLNVTYSGNSSFTTADGFSSVTVN